MYISKYAWHNKQVILCPTMDNYGQQDTIKSYDEYGKSENIHQGIRKHYNVHIGLQF